MRPTKPESEKNNKNNLTAQGDHMIRFFSPIEIMFFDLLLWFK